MADLEKSVAIIFEGVDKMGSGVDSATKRIDGIAGSVEKATQPLADLTLGVAKFEAALLGAGVAVTALAVKLAGDFDSQFREISTLIDEPTDSLAGFRQEILDYAGQSTQALSTVSSAIYNAISAGVDYTDSLDAVRLAERLAVAGKADLDTSLTVLVSSLNAYGLGMEDAERYSDLLFQTVRSGQTTLPELAGSLSQVTGLAATAGISFDELLAAVAALTSTGTGTSEAMTQIRAAISNIINPSERAKQTASDLGVEFSAAALESRGLAGVLEDVAAATGGNTETMSSLFGSVQALNGMLTLTGLGADTFADNLAAMENSAGATAEAYDRMAGTVEQGNQRIMNAMQGALIGVGTPLLDEFGGIQEAIAAIFNAIGASVSGGQLEGFVDQLEGMFGNIEETLRTIAINLPEALEAADFTAFFNGIEMVKTAISDLFDGADLTSAEGLATVIETIGLGFQMLSAYTAGAITAIGPFLDQLASLLNLLLKLDPTIVAWVGVLGGGALAVNTLMGALQNMKGLLSAVLGSSGVIAKSMPLLSGLVGLLTGPLGLAIGAGIAGTAIYSAGRDILGFNNQVSDATREINDQIKAIDDGRLVWDYAANDWARAGEAQEDLAEWTRRTRQEVEDAVLGVNRHADARHAEAEMMAKVNGEYVDYDAMVSQAYRSSQSFAGEQERTAAALRAVFEEIGPLENAWRQVDEGVFAHASNLGELEAAYDDVRAAFDQGLITPQQFADITDYYETLRTGAEKGIKAQEDLAKEVLQGEEAILKARQAVLDFELSMEELASNERIRNLELAVGLQTAGLEAETARIEAAFSSITSTVDDTGETLRNFYDLLGSGDLSRLQELGLEREIARESERRDDALKLQAELTRAQIDQMRARTQALQQGEGLIQIDSTGLEPALETIMWQIIEKVQLRANAEGAEFLLGI